MEQVINPELSKEERIRFLNLLKLAESSEFEGERKNAMAAAKRMAKRKGLSLEEAAMPSPPVDPAPQPRRGPSEEELGHHIHTLDQNIRAAKKQRDDALRAAQERGLDANERQKRQSNSRAKRSTARMPADMHAWKLVTETSFSYREIAQITGLDVFQVVHMKIRRLRAA
ncbi:MAG: DUF2786 domain-containing protein [Alphaproteobacteria bacterium]|jgi:hypothetical protein